MALLYRFSNHLNLKALVQMREMESYIYKSFSNHLNLKALVQKEGTEHAPSTAVSVII